MFFVFACICSTGFSQQSSVELLEAEGIKLKPSNQQFYVANQKYDWGRNYQNIGSQIKGDKAKEDHQKAVKKVKQSRRSTWLGMGVTFGGLLVAAFIDPTAALYVATLSTSAGLAWVYVGAFQNMQAVDHLNSAVWHHNLNLVDQATYAQGMKQNDFK